MADTGTLQAIWIKRSRGGPMDPATDAELVAGRGIVGNADQGRRRQVTMIEVEVWDRVMKSLGSSRDPSIRRANLMLRGVPLRDSRGRTLAIGTSRIRILGETKPCHQMEETCPGLRDALFPDWGGGAFGEALTDGHIVVGDPVTWLD